MLVTNGNQKSKVGIFIGAIFHFNTDFSAKGSNCCDYTVDPFVCKIIMGRQGKDLTPPLLVKETVSRLSGLGYSGRKKILKHGCKSENLGNNKRLVSVISEHSLLNFCKTRPVVSKRYCSALCIHPDSPKSCTREKRIP